MEAKALPRDFAQIPLNHPKGAVLASVPNTPQAQQAVIANGIPQTATIARTAPLTVTDDGPPQLAPIGGTSLSYAKNAPFPVIQVDAATYYALQDGVWFVAPSPTGPWLVATSVAPAIYTIPPTSPLYYATYVYVYGSTPQVVYLGYTPGYYGMVAAPGGLVVYGTGYVYPAWVGTVWYPPPATYGAYAAGYGAGVFTGFAFGMAFGAIAASAAWGWHGGCCWGGWHGGYANVNVYNHYGNNYYHSGSNYYRTTTGTVGNTTFARNQNTTLARQGNNVYATHDGNVYKNTGSGWQHYNSGSNNWNNVNTTQAQQRAQQSRDQYQSSPWAQQDRAQYQAAPQAQQARSQYQSGGGGWQERSSGSGGGWQQNASQLNDSAWARSAGDARYSSSASGGGFGDRFGGFRR